METDKLAEILNTIKDPRVRANCFNAVELFWNDFSSPRFLGPEEFTSYIEEKFIQIPINESYSHGDVTIVWSRSEPVLPVGEIILSELRLKKPGYPFGLIIEHAFVNLDRNRVFQKPDPSLLSVYEIVNQDSALQTYIKVKGFEITRHRRRS